MLKILKKISILQNTFTALTLEIKDNDGLIFIPNNIRIKDNNEKINFGWCISFNTSWTSTAYNLSVRGPILSLNSKKLSIAPISPFRPRRWKGKIINDKLLVSIRNLNIVKRPISAVADNIEVRNAKNIVVKINKKIKFKLLYDRNRGLQKKIKIEQLRKETN